MGAERSAAVPLSSPAAAERGANDGGTVAAAQSAMLSIALPRLTSADNSTTVRTLTLGFKWRISTKETDMTGARSLARLSLLSEVGAVGRHIMGSEG
jgi:hypothetical protein